MSRYPVLTAADLKAADACREQVEVFRATFPDGAPLTVAALRTAQAAGLDVFWTECLLDGPAREEYRRAIAPAQAEHQKTVAPAWTAYRKAIAPAREEYERAHASAQEKYEGAIASAWAAYRYERAIASAWPEYERVVILAEDACRKATALALLAALRSTLSRKEGATS